MYGPVYSMIYIGMIGVYYRYTKRAAEVRKTFISKQHSSEKQGDFIITEALTNYMMVKNFTTENFEQFKYRDIMKNYAESYSSSQEH